MTRARVARRRFLQVGAGGMLGAALRTRQSADASEGAREPIRACILVFYYGGPSHLDTFDMKPDAPSEVRGEFRPVATSVPGIQFCEHAPALARIAHKLTIVRGMAHGNRLHDSASTEVLTGRPPPNGDVENFAPFVQRFPSLGSLVHFGRRVEAPVAPVASLPWVFHNVVDVPCQGAGFLGGAFEPFRISGDASSLSYRADALAARRGMSNERHARRHELLEVLQSRPFSEADGLAWHRARALELLRSSALRGALDLSRESQRVRERYGLFTPSAERGSGVGAENAAGRALRGLNLLLARRLVEAGVEFVNVYDFRQQGQNWDAHADNFRQHREILLPQADRALAALIEDLDERGLVDSTLVLAMGEFGRTPKINAQAGRDHWPDCYSIVMAGGGVKPGFVHGASDSIGAYPIENPVTPADLAATVLWRFGVDPAGLMRDASGRPYHLTEGRPQREIFL